MQSIRWDFRHFSTPFLPSFSYLPKTYLENSALENGFQVGLVNESLGKLKMPPQGLEPWTR